MLQSLPLPVYGERAGVRGIHLYSHGCSEMSDPFAGRDASPFGRRQRRPRGARLPVTVVTGFLGAGKTTLIRELLAKPEGANTAVIVNEFGEVGIDDALLRSSSDATVLLGNGCLCCAIRTDLQETLRTLFAERGRGGVPSFERVIIETSGLADAGPVLQTIASDRALSDVYHLQGLVAVVGCRGPIVVHAVQHVAHRPVELLDWPDDDRRSRLVFITRNLAKAQVEALFAAIGGLGGPEMPPRKQKISADA